MNSPVTRERSQYRRGLVLGFTVAEALLLLLFALLLALAMMVAELTARAEAAEAQRAATQAQLDETKHNLMLESVRRELAEAGARGIKIPEDFVGELAQARETQAKADLMLSQLSEREDKLRQREELSTALQGVPDAQKRAELESLAALGQQVKSTLPDATSPENLASLIEKAVLLEEAIKSLDSMKDATGPAEERVQAVASEISTLRGQVAKLRNDLAAVGRGGEYPPCWVTEQGRPEYIFDVALSADGLLRVRDTTPPARKLDRTGLPVPDTLFAGPLSRGAFLTQTQPLFDHAVQRECRFFVRVLDETDPSQKQLFKDLLLTVEAHFYKWLLT